MSGNEFLKYPPHKNVGSLPATRYNLMRFQMESGKIPYMRRTFDDGIMEVQQIYKTQHKAKWTPIGGRELCYMVRYLQDNPTAGSYSFRYVFLDEDLKVIGNDYYEESDLAGSGVNRLAPFEYKVDDGLILVFYLGYQTNGIINAITFTFYDSKTGQLLTDEYHLHLGYIYNSVVPFVECTLNGIYVEDGRVYIAADTGLTRLTISRDDRTDQRIFTNETIITGKVVYCAEEGLFWTERYDAETIFEVRDKDTGVILYEVEDDPDWSSSGLAGQEGVSDPIKKYLTPEFYEQYYVVYDYKAPYDPLYPAWSVAASCATPFGQIEPTTPGPDPSLTATAGSRFYIRAYPRWPTNTPGYRPGSTDYVDHYGELFGIRYYRQYLADRAFYFQGFGTLIPVMAGLYTRTGAVINSELILVNQGSISYTFDPYDGVRDRVYWKGFNRSSELMWIAMGYMEGGDSVGFVDVIRWGNIAKWDEDNPVRDLTRADLYAMFSIPADAYDIASLSYLPGLGKNPTIKELLKGKL